MVAEKQALAVIHIHPLPDEKTAKQAGRQAADELLFNSVSLSLSLANPLCFILPVIYTFPSLYSTVCRDKV